MSEAHVKIAQKQMDYVLVVNYRLDCIRFFFVILVFLQLIIFITRMIQRLRSEATHSNNMLVQVQDMQNAIRLAFLNCFLDFSGLVEITNITGSS